MSNPAHVTNTFQFDVRAPLSRAATLFGPEGEKCWAGPRWNPKFLHPQPGADIQGAVFTVGDGVHTSIWINILFDMVAGRMQYAAFIPGKVVSKVDVRLTPLNPSSTRVEVTYARTALDAGANEEVEAMGAKDLQSGPEWEQAIEECLSR